MIELRGKKAVLRTMERQHCRTLWEQYELGGANSDRTGEAWSFTRGLGEMV